MTWMRRQWRALLIWFDDHPGCLAAITAILGVITIVFGVIKGDPAGIALGAVCIAGAAVLFIVFNAMPSPLIAGILVVILTAAATAVVWAFSKVGFPPLLLAGPVGLLTAFRVRVQMRGRSATMQGRPAGRVLVLNIAGWVLIWVFVIAYAFFLG